jgi:hypothetical protein
LDLLCQQVAQLTTTLAAQQAASSKIQAQLDRALADNAELRLQLRVILAAKTKTKRSRSAEVPAESAAAEEESEKEGSEASMDPKDGDESSSSRPPLGRTGPSNV